MKPIIKYRGGKSKEIPQILPYIPQFTGRYIEPFFGGGALFFYLEPSNAIINDINENLINFYNDVRNNYYKISIGTLVGLALIPILFYTYTGVLGFSVMAIDIAIFYISVLGVFLTGWFLKDNRKLANRNGLLLTCLVILAILFFIFSYYPPEIGLFQEP